MVHYKNLQDLLKVYDTDSKLNSCIIICEESENGTRLYQGLTHNQFINKIYQFNKKTTYHEIFMLTETSKCKIFLDVDFERNKSDAGENFSINNIGGGFSCDKAIELIKKAAIDTIYKLFDGIEILYDNCVTYISYSEGTKKIGVHILIEPGTYCVNSTHVHNLIINQITNTLPEPLRYAIDSQQNKRYNASLRLINSFKHGERIKQYKDGNTDYELPDTMRNSDDFKELLEEEEYYNTSQQVFTSLLSYTHQLKVLDESACTIKIDKKIKYEGSNINGDIYKYILEHDNLKNFLTFYMFREIKNQTTMIFDRLLPEFCTYCDKTHDKDNQIYLSIYDSDCKIIIYKKCFNTKKSSIPKLNIRILEIKKDIKNDIKNIVNLNDKTANHMINFDLNLFQKLFYKDQDYFEGNHYKNIYITDSYKYLLHHHYFQLTKDSTAYIKDGLPEYYKGRLPDVFQVKESIESKKKDDSTQAKRHNIYDIMRRDRNANNIMDFTFNPNPNYKFNKNEKNLFQGFAFQKTNIIDKETINLFTDHVDRLCSYEYTVTKYVLDWICHIFQYPHDKMNTAILLYSEIGGIGKNLLCDIIKDVIGEYLTLEVGKVENLTSNFNAEFACKLLVVANEMPAHTKNASNEFKDMITREKLRYEVKFKDAIHLTDLINFIFTTNNEMTLRIEPGCRRYLTVRCSENKPSRQIINELAAIRKDKNKLQSLFNYFMERDLSKFDPREDLPITEYKTDLIMADLQAHIHMLKNKCLELQEKGIISTSDLIIMSKEYGISNKLVHNLTDKKKQMDFVKIIGEYKILGRISGYNFKILVDGETFESRIENLIKTKYLNIKK